MDDPFRLDHDLAISNPINLGQDVTMSNPCVGWGLHFMPNPNYLDSVLNNAWLIQLRSGLNNA